MILSLRFKMILALLALALLPRSALCADPPKVSVGAIYPLSGDWAAWGNNCLKGTLLAQSDINAAGLVDIQLHIEDSQAIPSRAISSFKKLLAFDSITHLLGPLSPEEFGALAPLLEGSHVSTITFANYRKQIPGSLFVWMDPDTEAQQLAEHVASKHKRVAILSSNQAWESDVTKFFREAYERLGGTVSFFEELNYDSRDVNSTVAKLKNVRTEAVVIPSYFLLPLYGKSMQRLGIQLPKYGIELDANIINQCGESCEGLVFINPHNDDDRFQREFKTRWGFSPILPAPQCYDSLMILYQALRSGVKDKKSFVEYFQNFPGYTGASGAISMKAGTTTMPTRLFVIRGGKAELLEALR